MLHWAWPSDPATCPMTLPPPRPKRHRDPKPFAGPTTQPHCDACEHATAPRPQAPSAPPPRIVMTRGRRREIDTSHHFCPNPDCAYRGWVGWGNLRANGHPSGSPWRQLLCVVCRRYFLETLGTLFHGKRTRAMAQRVVHLVAQVLAPDCAPLFLTDGFRESLTALLTHYGQWVQPPRRQVTGPAPKPRWLPQPQLLYAQVVKTVRRRRLVDVKHRVVFGTLAAVEQVLAPLGWHINTAFVERLNLTIRQHVAAVGRRVTTLCKGEDGVRQQLSLYHVYYNFCLPHASLRQPLPQPEPTHGSGSVKRWQPRTPAMAAR